MAFIQSIFYILVAGHQAQCVNSTLTLTMTDLHLN